MARTKKSKGSKQKGVELAGQGDPAAALDSAAFLAAAKPVLRQLEGNLRERAEASPAVRAALTARYEAEKKAERTAESYAGWTAALATQVAVGWLLSCVFVRTLEDRGLLPHARLAGPGAEDSQRQFFQLAPSLTERDYLLMVFRELSRHPAAAALFSPEHSLVWKLSPSAEVAKELLALFRSPSASEPAFRFGQASTRFLGDLYQDLSEDVRKRYALLQTPDFVESYILDHTLESAIERFGLDDTTLIDPACGSGHFLLGAFDRLFDHRLRAEPGIERRVAAQKALDCVYGADINPYAVAIARFRLTLSFLEKAGYAKLSDAPELPLHLVVADSLRINPQHAQQELWQVAGAGSASWLGDVFAVDDERAARDVLGRQYAAVVANPPYITVKDAALRDVYRRMYASCHRTYALSAPFCERIFQLARPRGFTGQITANSFMKREFGKRLVEEYLHTVNLERIVNTSGAYIPGHGTPTVILFGTHEAPQGADVLSVLAKRGEPSTPDDASKGLVWTSIVTHGNELGYEDDYISVSRVSRETLRKHPWSLGGGGASELKELIEERAQHKLGDLVDGIGRTTVVGEDDVWIAESGTWCRFGIGDAVRTLVIGECVRDWSLDASVEVIYPYRTLGGAPVGSDHRIVRHLWPWRALLERRTVFGKQVKQSGRPWWEHLEHYSSKLATPLSIAFAFVATHNHFVLDRGGKVFKQSAPIIKLPEGATEEDHLALLAYLNSSTACFWMKQVFSPKGMHNGSAANATPFLVRFEFDGTKLSKLPLPAGLVGQRKSRYAELGRQLDELAQARSGLNLATMLDECLSAEEVDTRFRQLVEQRQSLLRKQISLQEEIDWLVYRDFELADDGLLYEGEIVETVLGARAFEIRLHQAGSHDISEWFRWNQTNPQEPPAGLSKLVAARIKASTESSELALLETGEFKRRWVQPSGKAAQFLETDDKVLEGQVAEWIMSRIESHLSRHTELMSWRDLQHELNSDKQLVAAHEWAVARGCISSSLKDLIASDSVPYLAAARLTDAGMGTYAQWLRTWDYQRAEDHGETVVAEVPPKYRPENFQSDYYRHRGPLDVPKERFISYPGCESDSDGEPVYGWAGWDHLQRAQALAALYLKRKDGEGWTAERLTPMLAGLLELIPWVKQWHNEPSEEFGGLRMGDYFEQFLDGECRQHGLTHDDLRAWRPEKRGRGNAKARASRGVTESAADADAGEPAPKPKKQRKTKQKVTEPAVASEAE